MSGLQSVWGGKIVCVCVCVNVSVRTLPSVVPPTVWGVALLWLLATLTLPSPTGVSEWEPSFLLILTGLCWRRRPPSL